ncbi:hypothetical protein NL676_013249 [Syzygium grande]|nr:hypothetical protein NL676_013249 [Syzygium grande]
MAISRKALAICIVAFVVCSFAADNVAVEARSIDYGAISKGGEAYCKGPNCLPAPSNSYNRGCEAANRCHGGE